MKFVLFTAFLLSFSSLRAQESLLLGEMKLDEIQTQIRKDNVQKVLIYGSRYKKNGVYKDSTFKGFEDYSNEGELLNRTTFGGKKDEISYTKKYAYNKDHLVTKYDFLISGNGEIIGQSSDFTYYQDRISKQIISLANISYYYYEDSRIKSKSYYYNNRGEIDSEPWTIWFIYDENKNLIDADNDTSNQKQTMFYNENMQMIKNDYYPGVAYSTFAYDQKGNCTRQVDYEMGKKDWDSTVFIFQYDDKNRLIRSATENNKGKLMVEKDWKYNAKGQLLYELYYKKNKPKYIYRYSYEYFKE